MKVSETAIVDTNEIMLDILFEDKDNKLYEEIVRIAKASNKTSEEILVEALTNFVSE